MLLNRTIFVDDEKTLLSADASNEFFRVQGQQVMLCTTAWLNEFYVAPFLRYVQRSSTTTTTTMMMEEAEAILAPTPIREASIDDLREMSFASSKARCGTNNRKRTLEQWDLCNTTTTTNNNNTIDQDISDEEEHIPMVMAVPIIDAKRRRTNATTATTTTPVEDDTASFVPGQLVRLTGLLTAGGTQMNERLAVVQERIRGRVIVRVDNHRRTFSVKPENLIVVVETGRVLQSLLLLGEVYDSRKTVVHLLS
jgi:hypothetical protein